MAASKKPKVASKAKPAAPREPEFRVEVARFAGVNVPLMKRKDGSTPFRSGAEVKAGRDLVGRYQEIRRRRRGE